MARVIPLLLLLGCSSQSTPTGKALIETKGWPIVEVHIEGPGGDRTTVPFEVIEKTSWIVDPVLLIQIFTIAALLLILHWQIKDMRKAWKK